MKHIIMGFIIWVTVLVIVVFLALLDANAQEINRRNIQVDKNYRADGVIFFMCNLSSKTPKTQLTKVKNCVFERCNLYGAEIDETNTLIQSNIIDTTPKSVLTIKQLKAKKTQLESELSTTHKEIPKEELKMWVEMLERIKNEKVVIID